MSAFDLAGAVVWTPLCLLFFVGAVVPSRPPRPRYGEPEAGCFVTSVVLAFAAVFCIARLCGAHA